MSDSNDVIPIGGRLGSEKLYDGMEAPPPVRHVPERRDEPRPSHDDPRPKKAAKQPPRPPKERPPAAKPADAKVASALSNCLEIAGIAVFSAGFFFLALWAGLIVLGLCFILLGVALGFPRSSE